MLRLPQGCDCQLKDCPRCRPISHETLPPRTVAAICCPSRCSITGFHGTHVTIGVIFLLIIARKVLRGDFDHGRRGFFTSRRGNYEIVETMGLYWHFVDLVWVFIFAFFYLW